MNFFDFLKFNNAEKLKLKALREVASRIDVESDFINCFEKEIYKLEGVKNEDIIS